MHCEQLALVTPRMHMKVESLANIMQINSPSFVQSDYTYYSITYRFHTNLQLLLRPFEEFGGHQF